MSSETEIINELPFNRLKPSKQAASPSRFKLGMYKQNLQLDAPRRNAVTLKWEKTRRTFSQEKSLPRRTIDQFVNDYAYVRPGPTIVPQPLRNSKAGKSVSATQDTMFVAALKGENAVASERSSMDKGLVSYNTKA